MSHRGTAMRTKGEDGHRKAKDRGLKGQSPRQVSPQGQSPLQVSPQGQSLLQVSPQGQRPAGEPTGAAPSPPQQQGKSRGQSSDLMLALLCTNLEGSAVASG